MPVAKKLLYEEPFIKLKKSMLEEWYQRINANDDTMERVSPELAKLATMMSHYASDYTYDETTTILRINPRALKLWLELAIKRNLSSHDTKHAKVRIMLHGSRDYKLLKKDPLMFNPAQSSMSNRYGSAWYVTTSDHVTHCYNSGEKCGSAVICLLLVEESADKLINPVQDKSKAFHPVYDRYFLSGQNMPQEIYQEGVRNKLASAYAVHDYILCQGIGIVFSTGKRKFQEVSGSASSSGM